MRNIQGKQKKLAESLRDGLTVVKSRFSYLAQDWVTSVQAADIDGDGDLEIILGSRDGYVRVLTNRGNLKWKTRLGQGQWISSIVGIPYGDKSKRRENLPSVIAGSRDGCAYALDQRGKLMPGWPYQTEQMIRRIYVDPTDPEQALIASEDRHLYVLDLCSGEELWRYQANGSMQDISICDVDDDGQKEILAASSDKLVYILSQQGDLRGQIEIHNKIYALHATRFAPTAPITILTCSGGKDLSAWTISDRTGTNLIFKQVWNQSVTFDNRMLSLTSIDLNKDGQEEIIVGGEDKYLHILNQHGERLWKWYLDAAVYSTYAIDLDFDGTIEVIAGLGDNTCHVFSIDPLPDLYRHISQIYKKLKPAEIEEILEKGDGSANLLYDFFIRKDIFSYEDAKEITQAEHLIDIGDKESYEKALSLLLQLQEQPVQHCWKVPHTDLGLIRTLAFGDVAGDPKDEIIIGNDHGELTALDIQANRVIWRCQLPERILMIQMGTTRHDGFDTILAVTADRRVHVISNKGIFSPTNDLLLSEGDWVWSIYIDTRGDAAGKIHSIILGMENNKILIYDDHLHKLQATIKTEQGIKIVIACDIDMDNENEIIAGSINNYVYAYKRNNSKLWEYQLGDRVNAITAHDIDNDGKIEIIVAAEDCYLYVLDKDGRLKWRYYTPDIPMDVDAADIDRDGKCEILLGVADGYMYVLNGEGDLLWKIKTNDRVRVVRTRDLNLDGIHEIALGSEDSLHLLQIVNDKKIDDLITTCWQGLRSLSFDQTRQAIIEYTRPHNNPHIRAFALRQLAGQGRKQQLGPDDFKRFYDALHDPSIEVKKGLTNVIVILSKIQATNTDREAYRVPIHHLLRELSNDQQQEIRLAIVNMLPALAEIDETLCFEYLKQFTNNVDLRVRRTVVRKLSSMAESYPDSILLTLLNALEAERARMNEGDIPSDSLVIRDQHLWIMQEIGRSLARFFDLTPDRTLEHMHILLTNHIEPSVLEQIASSARNPAIQDIFSAFQRLLLLEDNYLSTRDHSFLELDQETTHNQQALDIAIQQNVQEIVVILQKMQAQTMGETTLHIYQELSHLLQQERTQEIAETRIDIELLQGGAGERFKPLINLFDLLQDLPEILKTYQRREGIGDRAVSLIDAISVIDGILRDFPQRGKNTGSTEQPYLPEYTILLLLLKRWRGIIIKELRQLRGHAQLDVELKRQVQYNERITIVPVITNKGRSPADHVTIRLESDNNFDIIGSTSVSIEEISTLKPVSVEFTIQPHAKHLRLAFTIRYDDAEKSNRIYQTAEHLELQSHEQTFKDFENPYSSGIPIRDSHMFYGRTEDLAFLRENLTSGTDNRVVILTGQRRSGKTSLIYQLVNGPHLSPHIPVFIDLQELALASTEEQFLAGLTKRITETYTERNIQIPRLITTDLSADPTRLFKEFLTEVTSMLPDPQKLILLIDEFETLANKIREGQFHTDLLQYLRSIMQHQRNVNFLIAGAPGIQQITNEYWSTFFNIAQSHRLTRLKREDATHLITEPVRDYLTYDEWAVDKMHQLTGDQPYLIHMMCEAVIRHSKKQRQRYVSINDINRTLEEMLRRGLIHFGWIWNVSSPLERMVLAIMAEDDSEEPQYLSIADIKDSFDDLQIPFNPDLIKAVLQHLIQNDLIQVGSTGSQYTIPVGLIRIWLRTTRQPAEVAREENLKAHA